MDGGLMTPTEIEQAARERYNAVNSTFWSQSEIFSYIYQAEMDIVNFTQAIERSFQASTVAGQQEYDFPTNTIEIKRITYNGTKLERINFNDDDVITGYDADTTSQGDPRYFYLWNRTIALRPIPSSVGTLKIYTLQYPSTVSSTSTLEIDPIFHTYIIDYVASKMAAKDENFTVAEHYRSEWKEDLIKIKEHIARKRRGDSFNFVRDEEMVEFQIVGTL